MPPNLPTHDIVLLGIGHTNAHVLRMWRMQPIPRARLTCVSNFPVATYSGMLPGVLAGQYPPEAMEIDLVRLCAAAGARLILGNVVGLDRSRHELLFDDRPPLPFDVLSIGIGSVPTREGLESADETLLAIKPMQTFLERLKSAAGLQPASQPLRISIVGGGVGGVEIAFCLPARLRAMNVARPPELALVHGHSRLVGGATDATAQRVRRALETRDVRVILERRVTRIERGQVTLDCGNSHQADAVLWATSAAPPPLLARLDLPKDGEGFLQTSHTLQSTADASIFAVGDSGTIENESLPKAGVYAVRQGPVLWENIGRVLRGQSPLEYRPQRGFLKLINTGDGSAIGEYKGLSFAGRWAWRLKDRIDRKFMAMYQDYSPMPMVGRAAGRPENGQPQMRCAGCGGKIGGSVLSRALARLEIPEHDSVLVGLNQPDDVAVLKANGQSLAVTTDFFAAPLDDPYLVGRMAALNSASDVLAKGARPVAALAIATIPEGGEDQQEQLLYELLAGGLFELKAMGATLAGGHTIEGPQLTIGYTILAEQPGLVRAKGNLRPGDRLVLTKPLGTGVLLAAHMQARLQAPWRQPLLDAMLRSNQPAADLLAEFDVRAATDVTGFGLAGHLLEMLRASRAGARLALDPIPLLPGAAELIAAGVESTLLAANMNVDSEIDADGINQLAPPYQALFDPQTCGGLLIGVAADRAAELCHRLNELGDRAASVIGRVTAQPVHERRLMIRSSEC